jgi:hypothetical protein
MKISSGLQREMDETKQLRYIDLLQIVEAMNVYYSPDILEKNESYRALQVEFDCLATSLGYEDTSAIVKDLEAADSEDKDITLTFAKGLRVMLTRVIAVNGHSGR